MLRSCFSASHPCALIPIYLPVYRHVLPHHFINKKLF